MVKTEGVADGPQTIKSGRLPPVWFQFILRQTRSAAENHPRYVVARAMVGVRSPAEAVARSAISSWSPDRQLEMYPVYTASKVSKLLPMVSKGYRHRRRGPGIPR